MQVVTGQIFFKAFECLNEASCDSIPNKLKHRHVSPCGPMCTHFPTWAHATSFIYYWTLIHIKKGPMSRFIQSYDCLVLIVMNDWVQ